VSEDTPVAILRLFVYGTLKRGYRNHRRYCAQALSIAPASVWGRLYHLAAGYPGLELPENLILAHGTGDPLADARRQQQIEDLRFGRPPGDWDPIQGELVSYNNPLRDLPPIDRLENFRPGGHSMYLRVLVAARCGRSVLPAWTYWMERVSIGTRVASGNWER